MPVDWRTASAFCAMWHRHHAPPRGAKFWVGAADSDGVLRAVAIAGRPVARMYDNGQTVEVTRVASDGARNACSMLYAACRQAAFALGWTRVITYTHTRYEGPVCDGPCPHLSCTYIRQGESGSSLRAAGYRIIAERPPHPGWDRPSRPRELLGTEHIPRTLWEAS